MHILGVSAGSGFTLKSSTKLSAVTFLRVTLEWDLKCPFGPGIVTKRVVKNLQCSGLLDFGITDKMMVEDCLILTATLC